MPAPEFSIELQSLIQALALDQGEAQSLALLESYPNAWFLTDDAAARLAAEHRGYHVHGTIGLLIRSVRQKYRESADVLNLLRVIPTKSSLHLRPSLLEAIIKRLETEWSVE
jgi:predicted nucleic acid-binding protein